MVNRSIGKATFEVIYGGTPRLVVDLAALSKLPGASVAAEHLAKWVKATQEGVRQHLEKFFAKYKIVVTRVGDRRFFERRSCDGVSAQGATTDWCFWKAEE
jgi:hypothetical protein